MATAAAYPKRGNPFTEGKVEIQPAIAKIAAGIHKCLALRRRRVSNRSYPRIAESGGTRAASSEGTVAAKRARGNPAAKASATWCHFRAAGAAAVAMYSVFTVVDMRAIAP